jgi:hypothetical protein
MALAYTLIRKMPDLSKMIVDITLDGAYAAGGYLLSNPSLGMYAAPDMVDPQVRTGQGFVPLWNQVTGKLMMFKSAGAAGPQAECAAGDLSNAVTVRCEVTGTPLF